MLAACHTPKVASSLQCELLAQSALQLAAISNHLECAKALVEAGADVNRVRKVLLLAGGGPRLSSVVELLSKRILASTMSISTPFVSKHSIHRRSLPCVSSSWLIIDMS